MPLSGILNKVVGVEPLNQWRVQGVELELEVFEHIGMLTCPGITTFDFELDGTDLFMRWTDDSPDGLTPNKQAIFNLEDSSFSPEEISRTIGRIIGEIIIPGSIVGDKIE